MANLTRRSSIEPPLFGLIALVVLSSIGQVQKYSGVWGMVLYVAAMPVVFFLAVGHARSLLERFLPERWADGLLVTTILFLLLVFMVVYPYANSGIVGGGSDREDNLNIAVRALLSGQYPYYYKGYLGQPVDVLGGALVLAIPFVLLGNSAYQNLFWLALFCMMVRSQQKSGRLALLLIWILLACAPAILQELVTGGDLIANSIYVLLFELFFCHTILNSGSSPLTRGGAAILLGVGLASRVNFLLTLPLVFSYLVQSGRWKLAVKYTCVILGVFVVLTVPFYLYDPAGFAPIRLQNPFEEFHQILPFAGLVIPVLCGLLALVLSLRRMGNNATRMVWSSAVVMAFPVVCGFILAVVRSGSSGFMFAVAGWGLFFLFPAALAAWASIFGRSIVSELGLERQ